MGYRSDISIKVTKDYKEKLVEIMLKGDFLDDDYGNVEFYEDDDYVYLTLFDLKWYSSYTDVILMNEFIDSLGDKGGLIAVGEDQAISCKRGSPESIGLYSYITIGGMNPSYDKSFLQNKELVKETVDTLRIKNPKLFV